MKKTSAKTTAKTTIAQAQYKAMTAVAKKAKLGTTQATRRRLTNYISCLLSATQSHLQHVRKALL